MATEIKLNTENQVIRHIQKNARYFKRGISLPDGKQGGKYAVSVGTVIYSNNDVRGLVVEVCKAKNIPCVA